MIKMSKLGRNLEDMIKGVGALACSGISAIIGYWGYQLVSDMIEKGDNNSAAIGISYTIALGLLAASPAIAYIYNKYKNNRANQKV